MTQQWEFMQVYRHQTAKWSDSRVSNGRSNDAKKMRTLVKQSLTNCLLSNERKKVGICKAIDIGDTVGYSPAAQSLSRGQSSPFCRIRVVKGSSCCKDPIQANETTFPIWHFETCMPTENPREPAQTF